MTEEKGEEEEERKKEELIGSCVGTIEIDLIMYTDRQALYPCGEQLCFNGNHFSSQEKLRENNY